MKVCEHGLMARPKKISARIEPGITADPELSELAEERHNLNVMVTTADWERLKEAAFFERVNSVSDLLRSLIDKFLGEHPQSAHFDDVAMMAMREELERRRKRSKAWVN